MTLSIICIRHWAAVIRPSNFADLEIWSHPYYLCQKCCMTKFGFINWFVHQKHRLCMYCDTDNGQLLVPSGATAITHQSRIQNVKIYNLPWNSLPNFVWWAAAVITAGFRDLVPSLLFVPKILQCEIWIQQLFCPPKTPFMHVVWHCQWAMTNSKRCCRYNSSKSSPEWKTYDITWHSV